MNNDIKSIYMCFLQKMPQAQGKYVVKQTDGAAMVIRVSIDVGLKGFKRLFNIMTLKK